MGNVNIKEIKFKPGDKLYIEKLGSIDQIKNIAPAAVHIKELNHIDPISIESLSVSEVRNLDPVRIEQLDITNLPTVNLSVRQVPAVDLNVRRVPPVSIGLHQDMCLPSSYTLRGKLLGFELFRLYIDGHTSLIPRQRAKQEQSKPHNQSFTTVATAGNQGIPIKHLETSVEASTYETPITAAHPHSRQHQSHDGRYRNKDVPLPGPGQPRLSSHAAPAASTPMDTSLSWGAPAFNFSVAGPNAMNAPSPDADSFVSSAENTTASSVNSGDN